MNSSPDKIKESVRAMLASIGRMRKTLQRDRVTRRDAKSVKQDAERICMDIAAATLTETETRLLEQALTGLIDTWVAANRNKRHMKSVRCCIQELRRIYPNRAAA